MDRTPWLSTVTNIAATNEMSPDFIKGSLRDNAMRLLGLEPRA